MHNSLFSNKTISTVQYAILIGGLDSKTSGVHSVESTLLTLCTLFDDLVLLVAAIKN